MESKKEIEVSQFKDTMSSREIADITGKRHADVMRDIRSLLSQGVNECNFALVDYSDSKGETRPMYQLTKKGSMILASGYNAVLREAIINRWEELELKERERDYPSYMIDNKIERAKRWIKEQEELQQAQLEVKDANEHINRLVHNGKPYTSSEIAKELNIKSAAVLNKILSSKGIQYKQNGTWLLYSKYADKGLVSIKQSVLDSGRIIYDRQWTGKGRYTSRFCKRIV